MWILQAGDFLFAYLFASGIIPVYIAGLQFLSPILTWNQKTRAPNDGQVPWKRTQWIHLDTPTAIDGFIKNHKPMSLTGEWPFMAFLQHIIGTYWDHRSIHSSLTPSASTIRRSSGLKEGDDARAQQRQKSAASMRLPGLRPLIVSLMLVFWLIGLLSQAQFVYLVGVFCLFMFVHWFADVIVLLEVIDYRNGY